MEHSPARHEAATVDHSDQATQRAWLAARVAAENRGRDIVILDLRDVTAVFDFFVVVTGTSRRQIHAMAEEIDHTFKEQGDRRLGMEGYEESRWILLDYGDIVVHLFEEETRRYYALEDLWGHAKRVAFPSATAQPESPAQAAAAPPDNTVGS